MVAHETHEMAEGVEEDFLREHAVMLQGFAVETSARAADEPGDFLLQLAARNQRQAAVDAQHEVLLAGAPVAVGGVFRQLWAAVLLQAVCEARNGGKWSSRVLREDARAWLLCDGDWVGSFVWVCGVLDLCPAAVRRRLVRKWGGGGLSG